MPRAGFEPAAANLRLRPRGHWDRPLLALVVLIPRAAQLNLRESIYCRNWTIV
jgi:hypothetical protein